jgi:hypothetical protein
VLAELACGRVGDDGDGMAAQPVRPTLRLLSGQLLAWPPAVVFAWCGESFPHVRRWWCSRLGLALCAMAHAPVGAGGRSCEAETYRARRRLVVRIPLVGNWSEMQPTGRRLDVLPVWVLIGVLSPPRLESWP